MMRMLTSDKQWSDLKHSLASGNSPAGAFMVLGPSNEVAAHAQCVLVNASLRNYHVRYFLCSGSGIFRVPCYNSFTDRQVVPDPINAYQLLGGHLSPRVANSQRIVSELEQTMIGETGNPQFILIEYITPPAKHDLAFTNIILRSPLLQHMPILIFIHQHSTCDNLQWQRHNDVEETLCMLYLCGGRIREADWYKIIGQHRENNHICDQLIASRRVGSDSWFCYANSSVAEAAESSFSKMNPLKKHDLARRVLQALPNGEGYPLLAIASETNDLDIMLSKYPRDIVDTALSGPEEAAIFFDSLQKVARAAGNFTLSNLANINYIASLLYLDRNNAKQIYKRLEGVSPGQIDKSTEKLLWFVLGQYLALAEDAEAWEYASNCFHLSRACLHEAKESRSEIRWSQALIENGEALIAFKLQQRDRARLLVESALAKLQGIDSSLSFQAHMRINLGDVFLRKFNDIEAAMAEYEAALLTSLRIHKLPKNRTAPQKADPFGQRAAQKLGNALIQVGRYEEAIQIFETLLGHLAKASSKRGEKYAMTVLQARLALAQAYLKAGYPRKAALYYWRILRLPTWLETDTLKDVAAKLRCTRPEIHERLRKRIDRIISTQEEITLDVMHTEKELSGMVCKNDYQALVS